MKPEYKEHITILSNDKEFTKIKICARSLQTKVLQWEKIVNWEHDDITGEEKKVVKWKPVCWRWVEWLENMKAHPKSEQYVTDGRIIYIHRSKVLEMLLMADMSGVETWCRMKRKGLFTSEEFALIKRVDESA